MREFCLCYNANGKGEDDDEGKSVKETELLSDEETPCSVTFRGRKNKVEMWASKALLACSWWHSEKVSFISSVM